MGFFIRKKEIRDATQDQTLDSGVVSDPLLRALIGSDDMDRDTAMNIPTISACINKIGDIVSSLEVRLYRRDGDKVEEVTGDRRTSLLNDDTGDTLDACQFKKAMVTDMFLDKGGYAYIHKTGGEIRSIHYVEPNRVSFMKNTDPIFKDYQIQVNGKFYEGWQFIKLLRNTKNGMYGRSIIEESPILLSMIYASQIYEKNLVKTGGNKKGFVKATKKLSEEAMKLLKNAFRSLYSNNTENVVILNDGLDFKESSNNSVEMQLNENKKTNNEDVCKVFGMPPTIVAGNASESDKKQFLEDCIIPILTRFAKAVNSVLLNEDEKETLFFAFDTTDLLKGDIEKRYKAYREALDAGFMQLDEVRKNEKLPAFGLDFIKLGLQDVLYFPEENKVYTPNTNKVSELDKKGQEEGGENDEDRDPG